MLVFGASAPVNVSCKEIKVASCDRLCMGGGQECRSSAIYRYEIIVGDQFRLASWRIMHSDSD